MGGRAGRRITKHPSLPPPRAATAALRSQSSATPTLHLLGENDRDALLPGPAPVQGRPPLPQTHFGTRPHRPGPARHRAQPRPRARPRPSGQAVHSVVGARSRGSKPMTHVYLTRCVPACLSGGLRQELPRAKQVQGWGSQSEWGSGFKLQPPQEPSCPCSVSRRGWPAGCEQGGVSGGSVATSPPPPHTDRSQPPGRPGAEPVCVCGGGAGRPACLGG